MILAAVAHFERFVDRVVPAAFLALGLATAGAFAFVGA
jgi:hypothetical protein